MEVWEINTHPTLPMTPGPGDPLRGEINDLAARRLVEAFQALDREPAGTARVATGVSGGATRVVQGAGRLMSRIWRRWSRIRWAAARPKR
jgi:hypothetical protein